MRLRMTTPATSKWTGTGFESRRSRLVHEAGEPARLDLVAEFVPGRPVFPRDFP